MLAYSAGLRVSEIVALKISDIDSDRMFIKVRRAKGKKTGWWFYQKFYWVN
jgi:integrase/recombinase XerD